MQRALVCCVMPKRHAISERAQNRGRVCAIQISIQLQIVPHAIRIISRRGLVLHFVHELILVTGTVTVTLQEDAYVRPPSLVLIAMIVFPTFILPEFATLFAMLRVCALALVCVTCQELAIAPATSLRAHVSPTLPSQT
jgi:hypothetical protein